MPRPSPGAQPDHLEVLRAALDARYRVDDWLAEGGWATVYRAHDLRRDREVAVKVLKPETSDGSRRERFRREIETVARLSHPNILPILDSGDEDGLAYFVMPYVNGPSLAQRIARDGQLSVEEVLDVGSQLADAIEHAHAQGVVHRDIKPQNILFQDGRALLADFGIAWAITDDDGERLTQTGLLVGTPAYMAPELADRDRVLDGRADIYALACVLYEMLTGSPPFLGRTAQAVLARHLVDPVPPIRTLRSSVPRPMEAAILRGLAKVPADRFATAREFTDALTAVSPAAEPAAHSLAVMPFVNLSASPENEYFADGITDEITNRLARIRSLRVAPRTSSFAFKGQGADIQTAAARLGVAAVLEGSVRQSGDRLRVSAQLIDVDSGYSLWANRYDRQMIDVWDIQDEIASEIAESLKVQLVPPGGDLQAPASGTRNLEAYDFYLKGRHYWYKRYKVGLQTALEYFEQSRALEPEYAPALSGIAGAYTLLGAYAFVPPDAARSRALPAAEQAMTLGGDHAEVVFALAGAKFFFDWDFPAIDGLFRRTLEIDPGHADALVWWAVSVAVRGNTDQAAAMAARARQLDPDSIYVASIEGFCRIAARQMDSANRVLTWLLEREPEMPSALSMLGEVRSVAGDHDGALRALEKCVALANRAPIFVGALGIAHARAGNAKAADEVLTELLDRSETEYVSPSSLVGPLLFAGRTEDAHDKLRDAIRMRDPSLFLYFPLTYWESVTTGPEWGRYREEAGLPASFTLADTAWEQRGSS